METTFKYLFNIEYNDKLFAIFVDENHRRTFLEINNKGEYIYPDIKDFLYLHNIYNNKNPNVEEIRQFKYKEKVRIKAGVLSVAFLLSHAGTLLSGIKTPESIETSIVENIDLPEENETNEQIETVYIKNVSELDAILNYSSVSPIEIKDAIAKSTLPTDYKEGLNSITDALLNVDPRIDLRVFYENIKTLEVEEFDTLEELVAKYYELYNKEDAKISGFYDSSLNKIFTTKDKKPEVMIHELAHTTWTFNRTIGTTRYIRYNNEGYSLTEAMTNKITKLILPTTTYRVEGDILDYSLSSVNFTFKDYYDTGIWHLIERLESAYPDVDIPYIVDSADTNDDTLIYLGTKTELKDCPDLLDELFEICKRKINQTSNIYAQYKEFVKLLDLDFRTCEKYFILYNEYLESLGFKDIISYEEAMDKINNLLSVETIIVSKSGIKPRIDNNHILDENCEIKASDESSHTKGESYTVLQNDLPLMGKNVFSRIDYLGTPDFWQEYIDDNYLVPPQGYKKMPITFNGELVADTYPSNISLSIITNAQNEVGFFLVEKGNVLYQSFEDYDKISTSIFLDEYVSGWCESIELTNFLNEDYLKQLINDFGSYKIRNIRLENDQITIIPLYTVKINDKTLFLDDCYIYKQLLETSEAPESSSIYFHYGIFVYKDLLKTNIENIPDGETNLEEVLKYYGKLKNEDTTYTFTLAEIAQLFDNYFTDISLKNAR